MKAHGALVIASVVIVVVFVVVIIVSASQVMLDVFCANLFATRALCIQITDCS